MPGTIAYISMGLLICLQAKSFPLEIFKATGTEIRSIRASQMESVRQMDQFLEAATASCTIWDWVYRRSTRLQSEIKVSTGHASSERCREWFSPTFASVQIMATSCPQCPLFLWRLCLSLMTPFFPWPSTSVTLYTVFLLWQCCKSLDLGLL